MGSGSSSAYAGTHGSSQPYAPSYGVTKPMRQHDVDRGIYGTSGYTRNPTAKPIKEAINGDYIGDKHTNRQFIYAIDLDGNIVIGERNGNGRDGDPTPHPTLIGGKNPRVQVAGILDVRGGKIYSYDDRSGHFKPNHRSLEAADEAFSKLPANLFHRHFRRRH